MSRRDSSGSDLGPSALPSGVPDGSLLNAGGLQLPSHFPKGGAQGWNRTWDLVDMEPKRYSMCYRASLSELVWNLHTIYLCTLQSSPHVLIKKNIYIESAGPLGEGSKIFGSYKKISVINQKKLRAKIKKREMKFLKMSPSLE